MWATSERRWESAVNDTVSGGRRPKKAMRHASRALVLHCLRCNAFTRVGNRLGPYARKRGAIANTAQRPREAKSQTRGNPTRRG